MNKSYKLVGDIITIDDNSVYIGTIIILIFASILVYHFYFKKNHNIQNIDENIDENIEQNNKKSENIPISNNSQQVVINSNFIGLNFPNSRRFQDAQIEICIKGTIMYRTMTTTNMELENDKNRLIKISIGKEDTIDKIIIKTIYGEQYIYEKPVANSVINIIPDIFNNNNNDNKIECNDMLFDSCKNLNDNIVLKNNYSEFYKEKYPYVVYDKPFIWRKFDNIRY